MTFEQIKDRLQINFKVDDCVKYDPLDESVYMWEMPIAGTVGTITNLTFHYGFLKEFGVQLELIEFKTNNGKKYHCFKDDLIHYKP